MNNLISRQAAIKAIDDLPNCYNGYSDTYDKSLIIGVIEELPSAQPIDKDIDVPSTDTISRQAAMELFDRDHSGKYWGRINNDILHEIWSDLKSLPPAQPERKTGEWLELTNANHTYVCSACGRMLVNITDGKNTVTKNYPFCHCGADMRGEE